MATTTTNFGWDIPQSTDLVKDGATAIAALGQDIDTALVDLKGGTTGQVLAKATNTDLDYTWTTPQVGDITAVTAGTGISGGGTTGAVTITNSMATAIDAKGDLVAGTGADAFARLAVGANDTVLTADSTTATGLKWATPASTSGPAFAAFRSTNQTVSAGTFTKIQLNSEDFDTDNCFDSTTNYRFTPTKAGKYLFTLCLCANGADNYSSIYKNGVEIKNTGWANNGNVANGSQIVSMNGTTDYVEFYGFNSSNTTFIGGEKLIYASGAWLRS